MARAGFYKSQDGWMLSDFYSLNHFSPRDRRWPGLVHLPRSHQPLRRTLLIGTGFGDRKIVLDVHQQPDLRLEPAEELFPNFLSYFRSECKSASKANGLVLLCVFCHGQQMEYGLEIGGKDEDGPFLTVAAISEILTEHNYKYNLMFSQVDGLLRHV